ncbi:MAG: hypothetical protein J5684_03875 [Eubacterium sp.]|nr:hypothetical protein [Eubacterium sp.]
MDELIIGTNEAATTNKLMNAFICVIMTIISLVMILGAVSQFTQQNITSGILYALMGVGAIVIMIVCKNGGVEAL